MSAVLPLLLSLALPAAGEPPSVRYVTKVVTKSWQPLDLPEVERMVEAKALEPLTAAGAMRLERSSYADLEKADYKLMIDGRFIEEAEKFSVYLTFGSGQRKDLPSFHVSDTEALGGLARSVMQEKIEALGRRAGKRLAGVLAPMLESARLHVDAPPIEDPSLPWEWGAIDVPRVSSPTEALKELLDVSNPHDVRWKALGTIKSQVFDQPAARDAVSLCVLRDPLPALRASCAGALAPVARTHVPTQRLILHAMRNDVDDQVLSELTALAKTFVGLSRKECIETWLELIASDATPSSSAGSIAQVLAEEGDVPNLDLAVAKCLRQEALAYGKKHACAQWLLRVIPPSRRRAVVWRYLEDVRVWEQGESNVFDEVKRNIEQRGSKEKLDPAIAELFLRIAERRSAGHARDDAIYILMEHPKPTPAIIERVIRLGLEPELTRASMRAIQDLVGTAPELREMTLGALRKLDASERFMRQKWSGDPSEEIRRTIDWLENMQVR